MSKIQIVKHAGISDSQEEYIISKIETLFSIGAFMENEASHATIDVEGEDHANADEHFLVRVNISVPGTSFHAETLGHTPEEAVDLTEEKLRRQIRKHKETHEDSKDSLEAPKSENEEYGY